MKILIDNGHGRETPGKRSPDGRLLEYAQNRLLARGIVDGLTARGLDAALLVPEPTDIPLPERCRRVNEWYGFAVSSPACYSSRPCVFSALRAVLAALRSVLVSKATKPSGQAGHSRPLPLPAVGADSVSHSATGSRLAPSSQAENSETLQVP